MMQKSALVTAVITTYKRPIKTVQRAVQSVVNQTYENLEIILVNDNPEDEKMSEDLLQLCSKFCRNVIYEQMPRNSGANSARNHGARMAKGEFIAFLDDDDEWAERKIELQMDKMTNKEVGIVYCNTWINSEKKHNIQLHYKGEMPEGDIYGLLFKRNFVGSTSFPLIRKEAFDSVEGFNEDMPAIQDMELWLRIAKSYKVRYVNEPLGTYYFYIGDRISAHPEKRVYGYEQIYKQHENFLDNNKKIKAGFDILGVTIYVNARRFKKALKLLKEAIVLDPLNVKTNTYTFVKLIIRIFIRAKIV